MTVIGQGTPDGILPPEKTKQIIRRAVEDLAPDGQRVMVITPDHTRTCPLPLVVRELHAAMAGRVKKLDFLIALGTHPALPEEAIDKLFGIEPGRRSDVLPGSEVFNHDWKNPDALTTIGRFTKNQIAGYLSEGNQRFARDIDVTINKRVLDYDVLLIAGPVFPHEVVGFSGGAKYFFPGICGAELLNFFHWLGALITIPKMIGVQDTPVRKLLHEAMAMIDRKKVALSMVVKGSDLAGLYFGEVRGSWQAAAELSEQTHITFTDRAYDSVLSQAPPMYDELWTGGKCMYKMECAVADGGELIIYAPHIDELAVAHGEIIKQVGYHCLPFFVQQWEKYKDYPWGVLAHSTHVRGIGKYDAASGEQCRVQVTLATGIPEDVCRQISLGYRHPASIDPDDWTGKEDQGRLYVPKAGEMLYRIRPDLAPEWQRCKA